MSLRPNRLVLPLLTLLGTALFQPAQSQIVDPFYSSNYSIIFNGPAGDVPINYGGLLFKAGDPNTLLLMGNANDADGVLNSVSVFRGAGNHIIGLGAVATPLATAANNDGGLIYAPNGTLLYTRYSSNELGQIKPGSSTTNKVVDLSPLGVASSVGTLQYVPTGFSGAGKLKLLSYTSGNWYDMTLADDGSGTYNVSFSPVVATTANEGPEGLVYVNNSNPLFGTNSLLLTEYGQNRVSSYEADADGNAIVGTRKDFITGLLGAEGGTIDPMTGDFVFSTFGSINRVVVVSGFTTPQADATPEPGAIALLTTSGLVGTGLMLRRRRKA
jgi:hypothetical protein